MRVPINEASASQLAEFAQTHLGLDVNYRIGADALRAKLANAAYRQDFIELPDEQPSVERVEPPVADASSGAEPKRRIMIHEQDDDKNPVFLSVNGSAMYVPRGREVTIPHRYFEVLKHAEKAVYSTDENGSLITPPRMVPQYPFSDLGAA